MRAKPAIAPVLLCALWSVTGLSMPGAAAAEGLGGAPEIESLAGEHLDFVIRWGRIPAGRATLEVDAAGGKSLILRATARSLQWIDWMYPVRERMESTVTLPGLLTERLLKTSRDGRRRTRVEEVVFDRRAGTATYRRNDEEKEPLAVPTDARDALASFYAFRTLDFEGEEVELEITDGKRVINGIVRVLGRDRVETPAGTFRTVKIEPRIEGIGGVIKRSPGARVFIWLTDDEWRRPVKIRTRVALGRVTALLTAISHGSPNP